MTTPPEPQRSVLIPPLNFAMVAKGVYRSGYPNAKNHTFLSKLKLKSILYLCPEEYSAANMKFMSENGIQLLHYGIKGNKVREEVGRCHSLARELNCVPGYMLRHFCSHQIGLSAAARPSIAHACTRSHS